jgi:uncharacterized protein (TIGR02246 family)
MIRPTDVIGRLGELLGAGDAAGALTLYEDDATFVVEPGTIAAGRHAIGRALDGLAAMHPVLRSDVEQVVYAGDLALVTNSWTLDGVTADGEPVHLAGRSSDVLRQTPDGEWRIAIDDPWSGER